ncbi:hypothetical protein [Streptomyces flaveolus]|uniref:hypothetical protein n=1 Tax=Streptomyces flaveolus TaxID=67297 RepID=UPI0037FF18E3
MRRLRNFATAHRRVAVLGAALALGLAGTAATPASADPAPVVTCAGSALQQYSPGLTLTTRPTQVTSNQSYTTCVDATVGPHGGPITSATSSVTFNAPLSCLVSPPALPVEVTIHWNGGRTSTAQTLAVVSRTTGTTIATDTGTITSGLFEGKVLNVTVVYPALNITDCLLGSGVTQIPGIATLAVTPV